MQSYSREELNSLSSAILSSAIEVHREMGPGLLESVYHECMIYELRSRSIKVDVNEPVPLVYKTTQLKKEYVIDLLVEREIIIELKAVESILPIHEAQLHSYLKLTNLRLGLLINFNVMLLKQGVKRMVNRF